MANGKLLGSLLGLGLTIGVVNSLVKPNKGSVISKLEKKKKSKGGDDWLAKELNIQDL